MRTWLAGGEPPLSVPTPTFCDIEDSERQREHSASGALYHREPPMPWARRHRPPRCGQVSRIYCASVAAPPAACGAVGSAPPAFVSLAK